MTNLHSRPLRSALYLPASNQRAIEKARTLPADAVIFDLEDAVLPEARPAARDNLRHAFAQGRVAAGINVIRVNALDSEDFEHDLATALQCRPDAVLVPKVSGPSDVEAVWRRLGNDVSLWCMIETASGLQRVGDIAAVPSPDGVRAVDALVIGTNDIARETGVSLDRSRLYMQSWLMMAVLAAKANGLGILDGVWNDFKNEAGFAEEATQGRMMGFDGKTLIHPSQIDPANRAFTPSLEALAEARAIVSAFADPANAGKGVINLEGRMVERLHLGMAEVLLRRHELILQVTERVET